MSQSKLGLLALTICFLAAFFPSAPRAVAEEKAQNGDYRLVKNLCGGSDALRFKFIWSSAVDFFLMLTPDKYKDLKEFFKNEGYSRRTLALMSSPFYLEALNECYPGDERRQTQFTQRLHFDEILGDALALAGLLRGGEMIARLAGKIGSSLGVSNRAREIIGWSLTPAGMVLRTGFDYSRYKIRQKQMRQIKSIVLSPVLDEGLKSTGQESGEMEAKLALPFVQEILAINAGLKTTGK